MADISVEDHNSDSSSGLDSSNGESISVATTANKSMDEHKEPDTLSSDTTSADSSSMDSANSGSMSSGPLSQDPMLSNQSSTESMGPQNPIDMGKFESKSADMPNPPATEPASKETKVKAFKPKTGMLNFLRLVVDVLLVAIVVILFVQMKTLKSDKTALSNQVSNLNQTASKVLALQNTAASVVGKTVPALAGQTPSVITLTTADLTSQETNFFTKAVAGDQLLTYPKSEQVVLYSPATGKVLSITSITAPVAVPATTAPVTTTKTK